MICTSDTSTFFLFTSNCHRDLQEINQIAISQANWPDTVQAACIHLLCRVILNILTCFDSCPTALSSFLVLLHVHACSGTHMHTP